MRNIWLIFAQTATVAVSVLFVVTTLKPEETPDTFLARADCALYAAKARGRNRVASA